MFCRNVYSRNQKRKTILSKPSLFIQKYRLLIDVLKVLQDLHQIGYLYIDLKLENIIYYQNHFYLIDFNACIENHSHVAVMASKSNCAPELLTLSEKDIRCDNPRLGFLF